MNHQVLIVDDELNVTEGLQRVLRKEPYEILTANSASQALAILERKTIDVVISDEKMPGMSGSEFLAIVCREYPDTVRIMLTGHASLDAVIRATKEGQIYCFFTKPWNEIDLAMTIRQVLQEKDPK